jgi:hypothetical protein
VAGGDLGEVFESVGAVVAGVESGRWVRLGPTSVIAGPGEDAFGFDPSRWQVDDDDGELLLTNVERLTPCDRLATGWRGQVVEPGRLRVDA